MPRSESVVSLHPKGAGINRIRDDLSRRGILGRGRQEESLVSIGDCDTPSGSPSRRGQWAEEIGLLAGVWSVSLGVCPRLDGLWFGSREGTCWSVASLAAAGEGSPLP